MISKTESLTFRLTEERRARLTAAIASMEPYKPSLTSVVERGIDLAIIELETLRQHRGA